MSFFCEGILRSCIALLILYLLVRRCNSTSYNFEISGSGNHPLEFRRIVHCKSSEKAHFTNKISILWILKVMRCNWKNVICGRTTRTSAKIPQKKNSLSTTLSVRFVAPVRYYRWRVVVYVCWENVEPIPVQVRRLTKNQNLGGVTPSA